MPKPIIIEESNIKLSFPDEQQVFRFENCAGYKEVKGIGIKEMDVCWYDAPNNALYLIELKNWGDGILTEEKDGVLNQEEISKKRTGIYKSRLHELVEKSKDASHMLAAMLLKTSQGERINNCAPFKINKATTFHFINIINWTNQDITPIMSIYTEYKRRFAGYRKLFSYRTPIILTKKQAIEKFDWVIY